MTKVKDKDAAPPSYEEALEDYALLVGLEQEYFPHLAQASQTHQMRSAVTAVQSALAAPDPATAGDQLDHALAILRAKLAADAALGHLLEDALTRLGIKVPHWITQLQNMLDKAGKPVIPDEPAAS